jgi:uncharacterized protein YdhG (YjbR/CyaY superfamily)
MKPAQRGGKKPVKITPAKAKKFEGFTEEERAAMKEYIREKKGIAGKIEGESAVLAKIAQMQEPDRALGKRLHAIIKENAPALVPRLWYGMPAYAKDDKVVCFFQPAQKFKTRYATLGFSDKAKLDEGMMWPSAFALTGLTTSEEERIGARKESSILRLKSPVGPVKAKGKPTKLRIDESYI